MIEGIPVGIYGPSAIAGIAVLLVLTGWLVPRRTHRDALHDRDEWRTESRLKDAQIAEKDAQLRELSEVGRAVNAVMRAIQRGPKNDGVP